ncbi:MAG: adenylate/guanylate cyclase domain-containing protein, partial [Deltaproteobacteria bacterium]
MEARSVAYGERKNITAMFADIKGSVELMVDLDPEDARSIVDPALEIMMEAVHRYEGYVARPTGDGIFALFGAPIACEDHARRAVHAALRMQQEIRRYTARLRVDRGLSVQIRVGLNTGEVVLRSIRKDDLHTEYDPVGHSTNLAARMEALARPDSILVSESTYSLAEGYFEFRPLGMVPVKGVREPMATYEVIAPTPERTPIELAARRGLVRFVGRERELAEIERALDLARQGRGHVVAVVGDP